MRSIGTQTMPIRIEFGSPQSVAEFVGEGTEWDRVVKRRIALVERWPQLAAASGLGALYDWLNQATDIDVDRFLAVAAWVTANPTSGLYLRQLPVEGVDTKWIEGGQRRAIGTLVGLLKGFGQLSGESEREFLRLCGLRVPEEPIRIMALDPELRRFVGGLRYIQAPVSDLKGIPWHPARTMFVENLTCAHSLPDLKSTVAVVGLGRAVSKAGQLPWIDGDSALYWGDIDTDGLEILAQARKHFRGIRSVLMDSTTLHRYRSRWVAEPKPNRQADRSMLLTDELALYDALLANACAMTAACASSRSDWIGRMSKTRCARHSKTLQPGAPETDGPRALTHIGFVAPVPKAQST